VAKKNGCHGTDAENPVHTLVMQTMGVSRVFHVGSGYMTAVNNK